MLMILVAAGHGDKVLLGVLHAAEYQHGGLDNRQTGDAPQRLVDIVPDSRTRHGVAAGIDRRHLHAVGSRLLIGKLERGTGRALIGNRDAAVRCRDANRVRGGVDRIPYGGTRLQPNHRIVAGGAGLLPEREQCRIRREQRAGSLSGRLLKAEGDLIGGVAHADPPAGERIAFAGGGNGRAVELAADRLHRCEGLPLVAGIKADGKLGLPCGLLRPAGKQLDIGGHRLRGDAEGLAVRGILVPAEENVALAGRGGCSGKRLAVEHGHGSHSGTARRVKADRVVYGIAVQGGSLRPAVAVGHGQARAFQSVCTGLDGVLHRERDLVRTLAQHDEVLFIRIGVVKIVRNRVSARLVIRCSGFGSGLCTGLPRRRLAAAAPEKTHKNQAGHNHQERYVQPFRFHLPLYLHSDTYYVQE